jgi:predicted NAD/FAD-binding protein
MRIAIIGTGISGLVAAYLLADDHEIVVYEANDYVGGHTNTVEVSADGKTYPVDTGFIVFNERTYPNFLTLIRKLDVAYEPTEMSFSVKCERTGLEYRPNMVSSLFSQPGSLFRPALYRLIWEIFRFRRESEHFLEAGDESLTLGSYLESNRYSRMFVDKFLIPMGAAIWSADPQAFRDFPIKSFASFFKNHGILYPWNQPQWFFIKGGSKRYVDKLTRSFSDRIRLNSRVQSVRRFPDQVQVKAIGLGVETYDSVIIAAHSDQALAMLEDPAEKEKEVLGSIPYQENITLLHGDTSILPTRRKSWASWNAFIPKEELGRASLTYNMNILQQIDSPQDFCVSLNLESAIEKDQIIQRIQYHHPTYTVQGFSAQRRWREINGVNNTYYCGAYWGYGFHEDGVNSALRVAKEFGKQL